MPDDFDDDPAPNRGPDDPGPDRPGVDNDVAPVIDLDGAQQGDSINEGGPPGDESEEFGLGISFSRAPVHGSPQVVGRDQRAERDINNTFLLAEATVPAKPGPVNATRISALRTVYIPTSAFDRLVRELPAARVRVLKGTAGSGRFTTAVLALDQLGLKVRITENLDTVATAELDSVGYVVHHPNTLGYGQLAALRESAEHAGAALVVMVEQGTSLEPGVASEFVIDHVPPDAQAVFRKYLYADLGGAQAAVLDTKLADKVLQDRLQRRLNEAGHQVMELMRLAESFRGLAFGQLTGEKLIARLDSEQREVVRNWLEEATAAKPGAGTSPSLWDGALLIATAVLDGFPLSWVLTAADHLAQRLHDLEAPGTQPHRRAFHSSRRSCEDWLYVTERGYAREGLSGGPRTRRVWLHVPQLIETVPTLLWQDFEGLHTPLEGWLRWLASGRSKLVRDRAAQTVGILAACDFEQVARQIINRWVGEDNRRVRDAAARALAYSAMDRWVRPAAGHTLRSWADPSSSVRRRQAAILAYTYGLDTGGFPVTAERLRPVLAAQPDEADVLPLLARLAGTGHTGVALEALAGTPDTPVPIHMVQHFLALIGDDPPNRTAAVLAATTGSPDRQQALVRLLEAALTSAATSKTTWGILRVWIDTADLRPDLLPVLCKVFGALAFPALRESLQYLLRLWQHQADPPLATIQTILTSIEQDGMEEDHGHGATRVA